MRIQPAVVLAPLFVVAVSNCGDERQYHVTGKARCGTGAPAAPASVKIFDGRPFDLSGNGWLRTSASLLAATAASRDGTFKISYSADEADDVFLYVEALDEVCGPGVSFVQMLLDGGGSVEVEIVPYFI